MLSRWEFEVVLSSKSAAFLIGLPRTRQRRVVQLLETLAQNPHQLGDYSEKDHTDREVQFILIGDFVIAFWPDHAVKEFRIVDIEEV